MYIIYTYDYDHPFIGHVYFIDYIHIVKIYNLTKHLLEIRGKFLTFLALYNYLWGVTSRSSTRLWTLVTPLVTIGGWHITSLGISNDVQYTAGGYNIYE